MTELIAEAAAEVESAKAVLTRILPDEEERKAAIELLAYAIENAHDEDSSSWLLRARGRALELFAGRLLVLRFSRSKTQISVMGPITEELRALTLDADSNGVWKVVPGGIFLTIANGQIAAATPLLKNPIDQFVDGAIERVRRRVSLEDHRPDIVAYIAECVGRPLPTPIEAPEQLREDDDPTENEQEREPRVRGRAPIFDHSDTSIATLLDEITAKTLALPDMQRPFVWENTRVRDLLDSLFVGYPVGTLLLWNTNDSRSAHSLGNAPDALRANKLVIDGQQRLTALNAVMRGSDIVDADGAKRKILIAFRPRDGKFEVSDAAILKNPEFIPNITELWNGTRTASQIKREFLKALAERGKTIDDAYENAVDENLNRAKELTNYRFPVVVIRSNATDEDVADVFVRINNQGVRLGQPDFVLTLLSVFHEQLRDRIENAALKMSENPIVELDPPQLLRVACATGFKRAKMSAVYRFLRGVDPTTGDTNIDARKQRLDQLDAAATECVNPTVWRDFILRVQHAGIVHSSLVASTNAITNAYALYVLALRSGVTKPRADEVISRWLFGTTLTARYSASSETKFEQDLERVRERQGDQFISALDEMLDEVLTDDFWLRGLHAALETQKLRTPAALGFRAAQIVLNANALFSDQTLRNMIAPPGTGKRAAVESHHLHPRKWLEKQGVRDRRDINQVANLANVGWYENGVIGARSPADYVPVVRDKLGIDDAVWAKQCAEHALPVGWEKLEYGAFLGDRRRRMAELIRVAYGKLGGESGSDGTPPPWFFPDAQVVWVRIAETELALRQVVREIFVELFEDQAAAQIEATMQGSDAASVQRALRSRPVNAGPLSIVDYLYLGQLSQLLFSKQAWPKAQQRLGGAEKRKLAEAIEQITPVRNAIAHVREVERPKLQKASVACDDVLAMLNHP